MTTLQGSINELIQEIQTAISGVLKTSTKDTLQQFEDHVEEVEAKYLPYLENFEKLKPGSCRDSAETILMTALTFTGFDASNCANSYNTRVKNEIENANKALVRFDDVYSQIQSIVVKAFIGQNALLTPEDIEDRIVEIFDLVNGRWNVSKPEIQSVITTLTAAIATHNQVLGACHNKIIVDGSALFVIFGNMVQSCTDFNNSQDSTGRAGRVSASAAYEKIFEEFNVAFAKLK